MGDICERKVWQRTVPCHTDKKELEKELDKVKEQGFALDREENEKDVRCIAAPIRNYQGKVIAAISISLALLSE